MVLSVEKSTDQAVNIAQGCDVGAVWVNREVLSITPNNKGFLDEANFCNYSIIGAGICGWSWSIS